MESREVGVFGVEMMKMVEGSLGYLVVGVRKKEAFI